MTHDQLAATKALEEKATKGPWMSYGFGFVSRTPSEPGAPNGFRAGPLHDRDDRMVPGSSPTADSEFIAAARSFVPQAIAEIERLRALVREAYFEGAADARSGPGDWMRSRAKRALETTPAATEAGR